MSFAAASLRMLSGLLIWALHFAVIYGFTGLACARGWAAAVPWVIAAATVAAVPACLAIIARELRRRSRFDSWMAAATSGLAVIAIVWAALPVLLVPPCA